MRAATPPSPTSEHPPLARDANGNLVPVPDGTLAWRLCRHTGGRPRVVHGPDREPLRVPLDVTPEDVLDLCGADTYRVYALDEVGNVLDYVTTVEVGLQHRNAAPDPEPHVFPANRGHSNDLRYALEAITHMARTCADSLRAVTEAQADWVKTIAMAKGLPRNVAMPPRFVDHDEADEDDEDRDPASEPARSSGVETALSMVAPYIPELMDSWRVKKGVATTNQQAHVNPMAHLARIQAQLTPSERKFLDLVLQDDDSESITKDLLARSVDDAVATIQRGAVGNHAKDSSPPATRNAAPRLDPSLMAKVAAIALLLEPAERARLMKLGPRLMASPDAIELMNTLAPQTPERAAEWVRSHIDEIEARFGS